MNKKVKKVLIPIGVILGIILIIVLWNYYFSKNAYYEICQDDEWGRRGIGISATNIVYYGPDIDNYNYEEGEESYVNDGTNGIICIYSLYSRWDEWKGGDQDKLLRIVGNVYKIYNTYSGTNREIEGYSREINKYYYGNSGDYEY